VLIRVHSDHRPRGRSLGSHADAAGPKTTEHLRAGAARSPGGAARRSAAEKAEFTTKTTVGAENVLERAPKSARPDGHELGDERPPRPG